MNLIGRIDEQKELQSCLKSSKPEFLVLYGRRRVGKTYLIREFFNNKFSFYASGINNKNNSIQLKNFYNSLKDYGFKEEGIKQPKDWLDAFRILKKFLESDNVYRDPVYKKRIVFLDELPWMDGKRSDFKAGLDSFWNTYGSTQHDLVFIVCGSATSWIMNNMIKDSGGFYNRLTRKIHLLPFSLKECLLYSEQLNLNYTKNQIIECYMVFGGIPYYWDLLDSEMSLAQNIDNLCFKESGQLHDEYQALFRSLFNIKGKHREIIEALMKKSVGMQRKELASIASIGDGKSLTTALEELSECGFIRAYENYSTAKNNKFYQLIDPFILFAKTFLITPTFDNWLSFINTPAYYSWAGHAFEILCLNNISSIKNALGVSGVMTKEYSWRSKKSDRGAQIDLLIHRRDMVINVCEIKYSIGEYEITKDYEENLLNKIQTFANEVKPNEQLVLTMITNNSLKENSHSDVIQATIDGEKLFL